MDPFILLLKEDKILNYEGVCITCRHSDGYVNATQLCKLNGADIAQWKRLKGTKAFLEVLISSLGKSIDEIIVYEHGPIDERSTWVHPQVAIEIAHWLSPEIKVKISGWIYELAALGRVELGNESSNDQIDSAWKHKISLIEEKMAEEKRILEEKLKEERAEKIRITKQHQSLLKRRRYYQFPTQNCFYIWKYPDEIERHKVGITTNINERLATERTTVPDLRLKYIVYLESANLIEDFMLAKFKAQRLEANHEVIYGVSSFELILAVNRMVELTGEQYEIESHLSDYNQDEYESDEMNDDVKTAVIENILNRESANQEQTNERVPCTWPNCSKTFSKSCHMYRHIRQFHQKSEAIVCSQCDEVLSCMDSLKNHIKTKHSGTKPRCPVPTCQVELANGNSLRRHMLSVHSDQGKVPCPICKKLISKSNLGVHIQRIHKKSINFPCGYCGKVLHSKLNFDHHVANVCKKRPSIASSSATSSAPVKKATLIFED